MDKIIDYKKVNLNDLESNHYKELIKVFTTDKFKGSSYFKGLFEVDQDGFIISIDTTKSVPWAILFFVQQVMINQRLRLLDNANSKIKILENKIKEIESKINSHS